jgi:hypothetical protein
MTRLRRTLALAALAAGLVALAAPAAQAQRFPPPPDPQQQPVTIPAGGTELFRALLDRAGIQPVTAREVGNMWGGSDDLIVVVIGSPHALDWQRDPLRWARNAVAAGGAALIATDSTAQVFRAADNQPAATFVGNGVWANAASSHHNDAGCPYAVPVSPDEVLRDGQKPGPVWNLFRGLNKLATNQPTHIVMGNNGFGGEYQYPLARLPKNSVDSQGQRFATPPLLAVGGDGERQWTGRPGYSFLAVADSSIYINLMVMEQTADNLEFTLRTIEYLQGPEKSRKRCLFFENGRVVDKFDGLKSAMKPPPPKVPPEAMPNVPNLIGKNQDKLIDMANGMADQFQTKDGLHNILVGRPGTEGERRAFARWVEVLSVLAAIAIAVFLLRRTMWSKQSPDGPPPPNTGAGHASTGPPGVFDRRQKELVRRNNLYEPVRNLMREFFDAVGAPPNPGPKLPTLEISEAVRKPESLRQAIRDMWRIAYGPPQPISAQRWFELEPYFDRLRKAHADGKWRFVTD